MRCSVRISGLVMTCVLTVSSSHVSTEDQNPAVSANSHPIIKPEPATPDPMHKEEPHPESTHPNSDENSTSSSPTRSQQPPVPAQPQEFKTSAEPPLSPTTTKEECPICENRFPKNFWFCGVCKLVYCEGCWEMQAPHRMKSKHPASTPHEQTPLDIADKVGNVLAPTEDVRQREELHREDEDTAWFGISFLCYCAANVQVVQLTVAAGIERLNDSSQLLLQDYGRLNDFLDEWKARKYSGPRTPSLVSFVGQTGAGKSSLVKLLIDFASNDKQTYSTPVIGSRTDHLPTSEDVHLYLDPRTVSTNRPILLADCEGLDGGDREPAGARLKTRFRKEDEQAARNDDSFFKRQRVAYECQLRWSMTGPKAQGRGLAVTHVYPRLLYAFSDVIVFVLRNHR